jgi:hypothetical protein
VNIVCVNPGIHEVRERSSEDVTVLPCGCASSERAWHQLCREHGEPTWRLHFEAAAEHDRAAVEELTS